MDSTHVKNSPKARTTQSKARRSSPPGTGFQMDKKRMSSPSIATSDPTPLGGRCTPQRSKRQRKGRRSPAQHSTNDNKAVSSPSFPQLQGDVYAKKVSAGVSAKTRGKTSTEKCVSPSKVDVSEKALVAERTEDTNAAKIDDAKEHTFLREASSSAQLSWLWLDWLSQIAMARSIPSEHFTWALKLAIGFLHVSDEPFLGHLPVKSLAILELFNILEQKDLPSKQQQLTDFIEKYKTVMAAAAGGASDSEKNSNLTAKATSTDTDFNSSYENATLAQDATSSKSLGLFSNEQHQQHHPRSGISLTTPSFPTEIVPEESSCKAGASSQQNKPLELCTPFFLFPALAFSTETQSSSSNFGEAKTSLLDHSKSVLPIGQNPTLTFNRLNLPISRMSTTLSINDLRCPARSASIEMRRCDSAYRTVFEEESKELRLPPRFPGTMTFLNEHRAGVLPMPETTNGFPNTLIPPKVTDGHLQKSVQQLATNVLADDRPAGLIQNGRPAGTPLHNEHHRLLVIPNHNIQADGTFQLTQREIEAIVKKGARSPLTIEVQGLEMTGSGNIQQNHLPTGSTTQLGDNNREQYMRTQNVRPSTQRLHNNKNIACVKGARKENDRWITCSLTSVGSPSRSLFQISGYVNSEIWVRMPATIPITQFEDKTIFKQQCTRVVKLELSLDEESQLSQVSGLHHQNLVAIAYLPGFHLAIVPILLKPHNYDIEVFLSPSTSSSPAIE